MEQLATLRQQTGTFRCADCGKCTSVCPLARMSDFSPRKLASRNLANDDQPARIDARRCFTCGACQQRCPHDVGFLDLVRGMRALTQLDEDECNAYCPHGGTLQSLMRMMALNGGKQNRLGWLSPELKTVPSQGEVFFWTGCAVFFDAFFEDLGATTTEANLASIYLLNRLGVTPVVSPDERCCGHDLLWNGDREAFERLARQNVKLVVDSGAKLLVTPCAECLRTWQLDYEPYFETPPPKMVHMSEFLCEHLPRLQLRSNSQPHRVTYQDPCRLGRHLGIYDPPRELLSAIPGLQLSEMGRSGRAAICCAGGTWTHCDRAVKKIQLDRLQEARATGANVLVTACPKCQIHLRCAMKDPHDQDEIELRIRDVSELIAEAVKD